MKYLILFLITFSHSAFSAVCISGKPCRVVITSPATNGNSALFDTKEEAEGWVAENEKILYGQIYRNSFGIANPQNYTVTYIDISTEVQEAKSDRESRITEIVAVKKIIKNIPSGPTKRAIILLFKDKYGE